ncbi:hypothetical protein PGTUg99_012740 [Puccinia graminis f. sp. tritici]|uniref:Uncharacterized protein n=2 Tax=Puccinia graminis f. sp. tritici TaxID=56615 RepID=A0A5B0PV75_PUCGR|nr:hypothetical protein PGTUg99_012740 [Puccinia graminis f. sp. tritici]
MVTPHQVGQRSPSIHTPSHTGHPYSSQLKFNSPLAVTTCKFKTLAEMKLTKIAYDVVLGPVLSAHSCVADHNNINLCPLRDRQRPPPPCAIPDGLLEENECGEKQANGVVCRKRRQRNYFPYQRMSSNNPVRGECAHLSKQKIVSSGGKYVVSREFL